MGGATCAGEACPDQGGIILRTNDGGKSWQMVYHTTEGHSLHSIAVNSNGWGICAGGSSLLSTRDRGKTWQPLLKDSLTGPYGKVLFSDAQTIYITGSSDIIFKSVDEGQYWHSFSINSRYPIEAIDVVNPDLLFISGYDKIRKSMYAGRTWQVLENSPSRIYYLHFWNSQAGIALGSSEKYAGEGWGQHPLGAIYTTADGGETWQGRDTISTGLIRLATFPSDSLGYFVSMMTASIDRIMIHAADR